MQETVKQLLINHNPKHSLGSKIIYEQLNQLTVTTEFISKRFENRESWLEQSDSAYTNVILEVLNTHGVTTHRSLIQEALNVRRQHWLYVSRMMNVVKSLEVNRDIMLDIASRIGRTTPPLEKYMDNLGIQKLSIQPKDILTDVKLIPPSN